MKRLVLIASLILIAFCCQAQQGEIIYRDFDPDLYVGALTYPFPLDTLKVDIDQDGIYDFELFMTIPSPAFGISALWQTCDEWYYRVRPSEADSMVPFNGTWFNPYRPQMFTFYENPTFINDMIGFRKTINGKYYYAWMTIYVTREINGINSPGHGVFDEVRAYVDNVAYCTIPDYPLRWGQTSLTESIEEAESTTFATIHPNPTKDIITVTGENLQQTEVFNMLGQQVFSIKGEGNGLQIDMTALPAGVYFVNVTDEEGRRCVRKVIRE